MTTSTKGKVEVVAVVEVEEALVKTIKEILALEEELDLVVAELVLNVAKKAICQENAPQVEALLEVVAVELVSNAEKKVTCPVNVQQVVALPEAVEAEPVSNVEKKVT